MSKTVSLLLFVVLSIELLAQDSSMKAAKKEGENTAKKQLSALKHDLSHNTLGFSEQDLLPDADKGKTFDAHASHISSKDIAYYAEISELNQFIQSSQKRDQLDENENFFMQGNQIAQNPTLELNISSIETLSTAEEESLVTCQEEGTYQHSVHQTLHVETTPDIKQSIKKCSGHERVKQYDTILTAKSHETSKKKSFKKNSDIQSFNVRRKENIVTSKWTHKDNIEKCDHFFFEEIVTQQGSEKDSWETEDAEVLHSIESNPSCKLLYTTVVKGPETHMINGKAVFREVWARQHHFSCEADSQSKCAAYRQQGAIFISKKCLQTNVFDECDLWEKIYDLGQKASFQQSQVGFNKDALWGFNNHDTSYNKNTDFGQVLTTLSVFSDLENNLEEKGTHFHEDVPIFKGEKLTCEKSFLEGTVFDCCKKMEGFAIDVKLASCKSEEKCLAKYRSDGKCRFIGSQKAKLGTVTEHVYCCFPSKLARVIHEQGRKQLGIKWGKADKPKCRGLSLKEFQKIDFSKIDLSEVIDDIKVDKQAFANKLKQSIEPLQAKIQAEIEKKRLELRDNSNARESINEKNEGANEHFLQ